MWGHEGLASGARVAGYCGTHLSGEGGVRELGIGLGARLLGLGRFHHAATTARLLHAPALAPQPLRRRVYSLCRRYHQGGLFGRWPGGGVDGRRGARLDLAAVEVVALALGLPLKVQRVLPQVVPGRRAVSTPSARRQHVVRHPHRQGRRACRAVAD